ncbi:HDOD domain-containing protein [Reinekea thalattae]|uniref:HDOD domain-containing protein n=1 Tax=Reinekea thalattae TaxID=2593301 RepID=A0A5C8ZBT0_9GAMM|nr:HDOD domain-containing protein [Reinekea thalattae]TXR54356.1 HDOD domain-containing protein [Reinekea thalattae]
MSNQAEVNIPDSVLRHLSQNNIEHALGPNRPTLDRAEVCLLSDSEGLVQVFTASSAIVDLEKLRALTGRQLKPLSIIEKQGLLTQFNLETFPAFDDLLPAKTIIDQTLFYTDRVFVYSGNSDHLLALNSAKDMRRKEATLIAPIASVVPVDDLDYELSLFDHDRKKIDDAVTKLTAMRIRQRLSETLEIPPLPDTAQEIIKLRVDADASISKLSKIVERDPSLAAQVVSWASSSYYSAPGSIKSVQDAIVRVLGFDLVMNLAVGLSLGKSIELPPTRKGEVPYWNTAVYVAETVAALVAIIPREFRPSFGLSYLAGLLHNFGQLILAHAFKPHLHKTNQMIDLNRHIQHQHIEKFVLGITRDQIAANLMNSWSLPVEVALGVRYQSEPRYLGEASDQAHLIYLAKHMLEQYDFLPKTHQQLDPFVLESLNLDINDVQQAMEQLKEKKTDLDALARALQG